MLHILGIIPARGGSKSIPKKNLVELCGKPLISWSIDIGNALCKSGHLHRCIVSTDSEEIARVAEAYGGDVPFLRPEDAASDTAKAIAYVNHALRFLRSIGEHYDAVLILQPTSPVRDLQQMQAAIQKFSEGNSDSLISCYQEDYINDLVMYHEQTTGILRPKVVNHNKGVRRQEHGHLFIRNGTIYITRTHFIEATGQLICDSPMFIKMSKSDSVNIDTMEDLELLRRILCK
jgi:CMP-N,N'-diacetyllegionaminic acid synthase